MTQFEDFDFDRDRSAADSEDTADFDQRSEQASSCLGQRSLASYADAGSDRFYGGVISDSDRFELISAYIDGELSLAEKTQVQVWLDRDPKLKAFYTSMLTLQSQMQNLEVPPTSSSTAEITAKVFKSLDRRRHQRRLLIGGGAIAASIIAGISVLIPGIGSSGLRMASPNLGESQPSKVMLAVALNKPAINIPKLVNGNDLGHN